MAHLDGHIDHLVEREEDRNLDQHRPAAGGGIDLLPLVERHHLLLHLQPVVAGLGLDLLHFRLDLLHLCHRGVGHVGQREENRLDDDRGHQNGDAEIADQVVEPVHQLEERLGDEIEPAPVDHQVEALDVFGILIGVDDLGLFGAAEETVAGLERVAGTDGQRIAEIVGLITLPARIEIGKARLEAAIGNKRSRPVLVGNAEPAALVGFAQNLLVVLEIGIVDLLQAFFAEDADQAFMQHEDVGGRRRAEPCDAGIGRQRNSIARIVFDRVLDREQENVVEADGAAECDILRIAPFQHDRIARRELAVAGNAPFRFRSRHVA